MREQFQRMKEACGIWREKCEKAETELSEHKAKYIYTKEDLDRELTKFAKGFFQNQQQENDNG